MKEISETYICEPSKNKQCQKNECYINGGECHRTRNKEFELKIRRKIKMFNEKELSLIMGMVVRNSVELQAKLHNKNYESDLEKESLERELESIDELGKKISPKINK